MCYSNQTQTFSPTKYPLNKAYLGTHAKALFRSPFQKKFTQYPSHRIFGHMHEILNVVEKITNYTV